MPQSNGLAGRWEMKKETGRTKLTSSSNPRQPSVLECVFWKKKIRRKIKGPFGSVLFTLSDACDKSCDFYTDTRGDKLLLKYS